MLTEERKSQIVKLVDIYRVISLQELMLKLGASESTIRRDLNELHKKGYLIKVHGGAMAIDGGIPAVSTVSEREDINQDKKKTIAKHAASLIKEKDVVYIDAGTTTGFMLDYLTCKNVTFITTGVSHAKKMSNLGFQVYMPGGLVRSRTESLIGADTCEYISKFHFTKGFFGTDGVTPKQGFTTPDVNEAKVKSMAMKGTKDCYVLCDSSKFGKISSVTFSEFKDSKIITDKEIPWLYKQYENVKLV